ncbi:MAG TPA: hypothetical protein VMX55_06545 [candidate division Zixibacteria bacterium]|nr:hypothetical protein [candidate division Zixibacteria bacterium]
MSQEFKFDLPKPEFIEGEIDFPEMIKQDFRKAMLIVALSGITSIIVSAIIWAILFFI